MNIIHILFRFDLVHITDDLLLHKGIEDLFTALNTSKDGLSSEEVENRILRYGPNQVEKIEKRIEIVEFLHHFKNPMVIILFIAATISLLTGDWIDALVIMLILTLSIILDFVQEYSAHKTVQRLKKQVAITATVLRDNKRKEIPVSDIVPGDIIEISSGDIVPADARLIQSTNLFSEQSILTGESYPVEKVAESEPNPTEEGILAWKNILFMGTSIIGGSGRALVVRTGESTEYGKIAAKIVHQKPESEFERGLHKFGLLIMKVTFLLVIFVFFINSFKGQTQQSDILNTLLFATALAVGLTPELLPMITTINLSKGAIQMGKQGVIIKKLISIQNLGSMDVLCTDKTGTLTENKIKLEKYVDSDGKSNEEVIHFAYLNSFFQTGLKNPLDQAITQYRSIDLTNYNKLNEIPFDFSRKRVSIIIEHNRTRIMVTKGAPEVIIDLCSHIRKENLDIPVDYEEKQNLLQLYHQFSSEGMRTIAIAIKKHIKIQSRYTYKEESNLTFLGFLTFMDPPKISVKNTLSLLEKSGIELKILTGDNELVTHHLCEQLNIKIKGILLGPDLDHLVHFDSAVENTTIFARLTPSQKNRIIAALKKNGHTVGFMGDGVNDTPSMKESDVSISVDNAVDVAKDTADVILLKKDLTVLHDGVIVGRKTFGNTMKYLSMSISSNFGNMISVAIASMLISFIPMLPSQILLNNLLYDISQFALPTDNVDQSYITTPKKLESSFLKRYMLVFGSISSIFDIITFLVMIWVFDAPENVFRTAWFLESLLTQLLVIFVIRTRISPFYKSKPSSTLLGGVICILICAFLLPLTWFGGLFNFSPPSPLFYMYLLLMVVLYLGSVELAKKWFYRKSLGKSLTSMEILY